jgi:hypothetical protein
MARAPSRSQSLQAPTGGWDTETALADMPSDHAVIMDNWFPDTDRVIMRRGHESYATGMTGAVETLIEYTPQTGAGELFAANGGNIYDISTSGAVGAAVVTGMTNDRWQFVNVGTSGGQFVLAFNGADTGRTYNGSTWSTVSITGPTATDVIWCNLHQRRLWIGEKDSLDAYYLGTNAISGTATLFSLGGVAKLGGYIMAMGTWTRDSGDGLDDVAIFLTSEGEAIVYAGTDPSSASTWSLIGVFRIGKPIGRRCMIKAGADLIMITQDGFVPASGILSTDRAQADRVAISAQIDKAVNDAVRNNGSDFGWMPILYPKGRQLLVNIPQTAATSHQYVFNTLTGAPCRYTGLNAACWGLLNDNLYFGGFDGKVYLADTGTADNGANIVGDCLQAFYNFRSPQTVKAFKLAEPLIQSDGNPNISLELNVDYNIRVPTAPDSILDSSAGLWDVGLWDVALWGGEDTVFRGWRGVRGIGRAASLRLRSESSTSRPAWISTSFTYVPGGQL